MKSEDFFSWETVVLFLEISIHKKAAVFRYKEEERNAERSWTPPLVCSISRFTRVIAESIIFWRDEDDDTNDDARFFFLRRATFKKREKKKNDYFFFHSWGYAVRRRGDNLPVFVFLRPRKDEKRCDDDDNNETILWRELFLLDEK